jgi:hypothetical protein
MLPSSCEEMGRLPALAATDWTRAELFFGERDDDDGGQDELDDFESLVGKLAPDVFSAI